MSSAFGCSYRFNNITICLGTTMLYKICITILLARDLIDRIKIESKYIFHEVVSSAISCMYFNQSNHNHFLLFFFSNFLLLLHSIKIYIIPPVFKRNKTKTSIYLMFLSFIGSTWISINFYFQSKIITYST